ncbi:hypothetical protein CLV84_1822 [Neolewinella xylanilytica]|uniref:Uncharacterized protein n=1 Tax=Neolewinella xylanilytica TaxID=1514080 RepID=A0A2S6IBM4_9BACT|nr:hypothetical protein [Neolewinella xylanilytica]PPK88849.1 hypothetical protein CLV84_1822 [Neolewinella xylanilytica]
MKTSELVVCFMVLVFSPAVRGQDETTDLTNQADVKDGTRQAMFNLQNPNAALTAGGAFYVSNPALAYEIDAEIAYLNTEFVPFTIVLKDGQAFELPARIRLIDQKVEVKMEASVYELDNPAIQSITDGKGRQFVPGFDPTGRSKGIQWYEIAFSGAHNRLLIQERTEWKDPPPKNMFDTSEARKTLKRDTRYYLVADKGNVEIDKMKDLLAGLAEEESEAAAKYVRKERLKNEREDYIALLAYLETLHTGRVN